MNTKNFPFISKIFLELSQKNNEKIFFIDDYGYAGFIEYKNGKKMFFNDTSFDINNSGASRIAKDKGYTKSLLSKLGYKTPVGEIFFNDETNLKLVNKKTIDDGYEYAKKLGFPLIVKPYNLSQGKLVGKVYNKSEYYSLAKKIFKISNALIVEKFHEGNDYRIVVFDEEIILCYERISLSLIGDGKKTILSLIEDKNNELKEKGTNSRIIIEKTSLKQNLKRLKYNLGTILPSGEKLKVLNNANLSTGGNLEDYVDYINEDFKKLAVNIAKDMGLKYCGIDILTDDISKPLGDYVVIEVNSSPGFTNYALSGERNIKLAKILCEKIFLHMGK